MKKQRTIKVYLEKKYDNPTSVLVYGFDGAIDNIRSQYFTSKKDVKKYHGEFIKYDITITYEMKKSKKKKHRKEN